jgi:hypothetical protein
MPKAEIRTASIFMAQHDSITESTGNDTNSTIDRIGASTNSTHLSYSKTVWKVSTVEEAIAYLRQQQVKLSFVNEDGTKCVVPRAFNKKGIEIDIAELLYDIVTVKIGETPYASQILDDISVIERMVVLLKQDTPPDQPSDNSYTEDNHVTAFVVSKNNDSLLSLAQRMIKAIRPVDKMNVSIEDYTFKVQSMRDTIDIMSDRTALLQRKIAVGQKTLLIIKDKTRYDTGKRNIDMVKTDLINIQMQMRVALHCYFASIYIDGTQIFEDLLALM